MRTSRERINAAALILGCAFALGMLVVWAATELMGPNRRIEPEKVPAEWRGP